MKIDFSLLITIYQIKMTAMGGLLLGTGLVLHQTGSVQGTHLSDWLTVVVPCSERCGLELFS